MKKRVREVEVERETGGGGESVDKIEEGIRLYDTILIWVRLHDNTRLSETMKCKEKKKKKPEKKKKNEWRSVWWS